MRAFRIAYDGRPYHGFQRQPSVSTVEDALLTALAELGIADRTDDGVVPPPGYAAAGRTDAGVSALCQTVAFRAPEWCSPRALNGELPTAVRAWASADAPEEFHATHDAARRAYRYFLHAPELDADRVAAALNQLTGTHDFHNLTAVTDPGVDTTRTVRDAGVDREGEFLTIRIRADGFLHEMVRRVVSLLVDVAGEEPTVTVDRVLSPERLEGPEGIAPAPAEPLVLTRVEYPDLEFAVDERGVESRRSVFGGKRRRALARSQAMDLVAGGHAARDGDGR